MKKMVPLGRLSFVVVASLVIAFVAQATPSSPTQPTPTIEPAARRLEIQEKSWTGDFNGMLERRLIRVLVPYSRSLYFNDKGRERGITADNVRDFERWINKKYPKKQGKRTITVVISPHDPGQAAPGGRPGVRRHCRRQPHRHRGAAESRGLRPVGGSAQREGVGRHRTGIPRDRHGGGPRGQDRPRAQVIELLREPDGAERAFRESEEAHHEARPRPRRAGGRGHAGDAQRGILEAIVVDDWKAKMCADAAEDQGERAGGQGRRQDRLGDPQGSPKLERR